MPDYFIYACFGKFRTPGCEFQGVRGNRRNLHLRTPGDLRNERPSEDLWESHHRIQGPLRKLHSPTYLFASVYISNFLGLNGRWDVILPRHNVLILIFIYN